MPAAVAASMTARVTRLPIAVAQEAPAAASLPSAIAEPVRSLRAVTETLPPARTELLPPSRAIAVLSRVRTALRSELPPTGAVAVADPRPEETAARVTS